MAYKTQAELSIIQKTYDLVKWFIPILNKLPRDHRFYLGDRLIKGLYELLEKLIEARYCPDGEEKLARLLRLNTQLEVLRYQIRLLKEFKQLEHSRYEYSHKALNEIGTELGGWIKKQRGKLKTF